MADTQRYVNTASSGGDGTTNNTSGASAAFASLSAWESASQGTIGAGNRHIVDCSGNTNADTTEVTIAGWTFSTGQLIIQGHRTSGDGYYSGNAVQSSSHYRLVTNGTGHSLSITDGSSDVIIDGIQVENQTATGFRCCIRPLQGGASTIIIRKCRIRNGGSTRTGIGHPNTNPNGGQTITVENCLVVSNLVGIEIRPAPHTNNTTTLQNNTIYGCTSTGILYTATGSGNTNNVNIRNNAISNITTTDISYSDTSTTVNLSRLNNYTDDATSPDVSIVSAASAWTSPGTTTSSDFSIKDTSSALYNNGTSTGTPDDDINGLARPQATTDDVGAWEFAAAGGDKTVSVSPLTLLSALVGITKLITKLPAPLTGTFVLVAPTIQAGGDRTVVVNVFTMNANLVDSQRVVTKLPAALSMAASLETSRRSVVKLPNALEGLFTFNPVVIAGTSSKTFNASPLTMSISLATPSPTVRVFPNSLSGQYTLIGVVKSCAVLPGSLVIQAVLVQPTIVAELTTTIVVSPLTLLLSLGGISTVGQVIGRKLLFTRNEQPKTYSKNNAAISTVKHNESKQTTFSGLEK